jgi:hypothetical protein
MKILGFKTTIKAKKLNPTKFKFNSLVDEPGNETAWEYVKKLDLAKVKETKEMVKNKEKGKTQVVPRSIECSKEIYPDLEKVKAFLEADGYSGFTIEEKEKSFVAVSNTEDELFTGEPSEIEIAPGAIATVDTVKVEEEEVAKSLEVVDGDVTPEVGSETISLVEAEVEVNPEADPEATPETVEELGLEGTEAPVVDTEKSLVVEESSELIINGKTVKEVIKTYDEILTNAKTIEKQKFITYMSEYYETGSFPEALAMGAVDGGVPGMDEIFYTLNSYTRSAFLTQDSNGIQKAFNEAGMYLADLKTLFEKHAMSELAKCLIIGSDKAIDVEKEKAAKVIAQKEISKDVDITKALEIEFAKQADITKEGIEKINANLLKTAEYVKTKVISLNEAFAAVSKQVSDLTNVEQDRNLVDEIELTKSQERDTGSERRMGRLDLDLRAAIKR